MSTTASPLEGTPSEPLSTATPETEPAENTPQETSEKLHYRNRGLPPDKLARILDLFQSQRSAKFIATQEDVSLSTIYNLQRRVKKYGTPAKPTNLYKDLGRTTKIPEDDARALYRQLMLHGWMQQDEIVVWLKQERGITCSRSTVSRLLTKKGWTREAMRNDSPEEI
jgi:transposase